jgi:hypothetical protein
MPLSQVCLPEDDSGFHYGSFLLQRDAPVAVISLFLEDLPTDNEEAHSGYPNSTMNYNLGARAVRF